MDLGKFEIDQIYCGDCVELMVQLPDNCLDLVVTSPPYDALRDYKGKPSFDLHKTGEQVYRILKEGGIAVTVIQDQTKDFGKSLTSFRMCIDWCDSFGFKLFESLIYKKNGAEGAWWNKRFRVDHEYMHVFLKGERPQYFNKENIKVRAKYAGLMRVGATTRKTDGTMLKSKPMVINPMKCPGTVWEYAGAGDGSKAKHEHPATYPDKLPYDFIQCFCPEDGIVCDPFMGSGSTALAVKASKRHFIGFEISQEYVDLANRRLIEDINAYCEKMKGWQSNSVPMFNFNEDLNGQKIENNM
jgi:site-specific DNA-methyltransferase (adenine-specific)